jgi:peptidoglycan/xylan/chitin deacetylase (PgdA/CDA1 family)
MMRNEIRVRRNKKRVFILAIIVIICVTIIGGGTITNRFFRDRIAEAVNVEKTLSIMSEGNPINKAVNDIIKLEEKRKADLELNAQREILNEEIAEGKMEGESIAEENGKIAYLTFDDGPSLIVTPQILDILDEYNIKATFFVIGYMAERNPGILQMTYERGHSIGNHTYSHNYGYIYKNPNNFLNDLYKADEVLKTILGADFETNIVRFPGGSFGKGQNFTNAVNKAGFIYYDWNSLNGDAEGINIPKERLLKRFNETSKNKNELIILMHDTDQKPTTVEALREIIEQLLNNGYIFRTLEEYKN